MKIHLTRDDDNSWSWSYTHQGKTYSDHDFTSSERAAEDARSHYRTLLMQDKLPA